jgi:uncharacterized protein
MLSFISHIRSHGSLARNLAIASALSILAIAAGCSDDSNPTTPDGGLTRVNGQAVTLGNGNARTYVMLDKENDNAPLEIGVALDEAALEGLPQGAGAMTMLDLPLPSQNPTPYRLVELDWNPQGHEPAGVYTVPHFDFHFYTITADVRNTIDPADTLFQTKADNIPAQNEVAEFYVPLSPPQGPIVAVPHMGVHWADMRAQELQGAFGHPENARPFTTTFLHGSWNGQFIFDEPMITRAYILGRKDATVDASRDSVMVLSSAQAYNPAGYRPAAYRVVYDAQKHEYRIALTQLAARQ